MNSYDVNQLDKLELKRIAIGKKLHKGDSSVSVADDLTINRDLYVDRDIHIVNQIQLGKYTDYGQEMPGAMKVVGSLSVSGNAYLGTNVQTTTIRNDIVVEDTLSVAGSVTVATCQNELPSNFMEFTRTRHATDDNTHVLIEKGDSLGSILFKGSDGTNWKKYVDIQTLSTSVEQDNEGGKIQFNILSGGGAHSGDDGTTNTSDMFNLFSIGGENKSEGINNEVVVNEAGINTDFRVESDLNENMIFVDSLANKIGIARDSPQYTLDIQGNSRISDHLLLNTISVGADSHGTHKAVIREDIGGSDMSALIYNTQLALFSTAKQSMNMGVMTDGKGVIQVIDNNNPSITYADLGIQPLGGQIAIGKQLANVVLDIEATDSIRIPVGTVAERPTANSSNHTGYLRYNSELKRFEGYGQSHNQSLLLDEWVSLGGLKDVDNDTYITVENQHGSDNDQIKFFVEDRQEMTLDKSGYLGIGITNPTTRLHVESNDPSYNNTEPIALFRSANKDTSVRIEGTGESYLELANVDTTGDATNSWGIGINNDKNLYFNWKTNSTLDTDTTINESNAMTIMQNGNIGVNKLVPNVTFDIEGEDAIRIPRGTTAQRPSTLGLGQIRYNTQLHTFEGYGAGNAWGSLGGVKDVDRDTFITAENSAGADNDELKFYTNQFEENIDASTVPRMIIKNDGKIGIHTNTPLVKFQITDQSILTGTNITNGTASIYGTSGQSSYQILNVSHTNQSEYISIGFNEIAKQGTYDGPLKINNKKNNDIVFGTNDADRMILKNDGKLGLGVSSPDTLLHVQKSGSQEPIAIFESTNGDSSIRIEGTGESYLEIANKDTTGDSTNSWGIGMNDDKNLYFNWKTNGTLNYDTNINERNAMTIMQNGNVGINKATPNVTFDIEGEDAIRIPRGNTAQRPTTLGLGQIRYNTQLHTFEGYGAGNAWGSLGGVKDVDRDTYITAEDSAGADNDELKFYTGQFEETVTATTVPRMIIKNDGKVGINIISPLYKTHINGNVGVEDSVTLQDTLSVSGTTNLTGNTIIGSKATTTHQLHVEGTTNITGATTLDNTLDVTGASILNSTLSVSGISRFSSDLTTVGKISARHTTQNVGVEITPFGGNTATNGGGRVFFRESHNSNNYGFSLGFNGGDGLNPSNLAWPSNTFCISRHNGNSSGDVVLSIDRTSNNVGLGTGIPTSNLHIKQTSGSNDCMIKIEADGGTGSNKPNTGIEFITNDGNPDTPTSSQPVYTSSKILSGWNQSEESYNQSFFKIQTHHQDSTLNDSFTIKGQDVGINNNSPQFTLDIDGTLNTTGATTLNNGLTVTGGVTTLGSSTSHHLYVKGNDIALGQNAGPTGGRALVHRSVDNTLIINYNNDFSNGVRIGGDSDNNPASNLTVTGATTLSDTLGVTGNTTLDGELTVGDPAHEKLKIHIDNINKYAILEYTPKNVQGTLLGKGELSFGGSQTNVGHSTGDIQFNTASANRMIIKNDGNVGIGTNTPTSKLHVMGEIFSSVSGNPNPTGISIIPHGSGTANVGGRIAFVEDTSTIPRGFSLAYNGGSGLDNTTFTNSLPSDTFGILRHNANSGAEASSASLVIKRDNGNVGIGTSSPSSKLHVDGTLNVTGTATLGSDSADNLLIKCNDVSLGPNAAVGAARAMVAYNSGSELVLNWANDFGSGVRIGNPVNGETSNLNVTGNLTVGQGIATTNNTHDNSYANIYKNGNGYAVFSNTRVATNPASISMGAEMYIDTPTSSMFFNTGVYPNNSTKMFIAHAGNVGIGTTSPSSKLHIFDSSEGSSSLLTLERNCTTFGQTAGGSAGSDDGCALEFKLKYTGNTTSYRQARIRGIDDGSVGEGSGSGGIAFDTQYYPTNTSDYLERMRIKGNGNVGIGTNSPSDLLHLKSAGDVVLRMEADSDDTGEGDNPLIHMSQDNNVVNLKIGLSGATNGHGITGSIANYAFINSDTTGGTSFGLQLATENKVAMTIDEQQNIGIGIEPTSKLQIKGSVNSSHFYYGDDEDVYIRGGKDSGDIFLNHGTSGKVGIGNNNPQYKLDITGTMRTTGNTTLDGELTVGNPAHEKLKIHIDNINKYAILEYTPKNAQGTLLGKGELSFGGSQTNVGHSTGDIQFNTASANKMIIKNDGNVGIGTTNPVSKLQVENGDIRVREGKIILSEVRYNFGSTDRVAVTGLPIENEINGNGGPSTNSLGTDGDAVGFLRLSAGGSSGSKSYIDLYSWESKRITFGTEGSEKMCLNNQGRLGIGVLEPTHKLDVAGTFRATGATTLSSTLGVTGATTLSSTLSVGGTICVNNHVIIEPSGSTSQGKLLIDAKRSDSWTPAQIVQSYPGGHGGNLEFKTHNHTGNSIGTDSDVTTKMIIRYDGNVGIGTTSPDYKLDVSGTFRATGATTLGSTLSVAGNANFGSNYVSGNLRQRGGASLTSIPGNYMEWYDTISATETISNRQAWVGFNSSNQFEITNERGTLVKINDNLQVTGTIDVTQAATIGGNLTVNGSELVVNGNLGIGTTNPQQALEVHGNILLGENNVQSFIHGGTDTVLSSDSGLRFIGDSNDTSGSAANEIVFGFGSNANTDSPRNFSFDSAFGSNGLPRNEAMRIKGSNLCVGIGNISPEKKLDVSGTFRATGATTLKNTLEVTGATTLKSTLDVTGSTFINNNVGIRTTPGTNCSLDIASISDTQDNIVRIRQPSTSHNSQIRFTRVDINGNDYGPEILYDKNQSPTHSVDSLNLISTNGSMGMNITWNGKVGIGGVNSTGKNLYVNGTFRASNNSDIGGTLDVTGATTLSSTLGVSGHTTLSTLDSSGATSLATGGGAVNISKSGVMTTVKGQLNVDEAVTLDTTLSIAGDATFKGITRGDFEQKGGSGTNIHNFLTWYDDDGDATTNRQARVGFNGSTDFHIQNTRGSKILIDNDSEVDGTLDVTNNTTIGGNLTVNGTELRINGDLVVEGTTTTLNTTNLDITDKDITLAKNSNNNAAANGAGFIIDAGNDTNKEFKYNSTGDKFTTNIPLDVKGTINCKHGDLDCGIKIIPQQVSDNTGPGSGTTNAGGRIFFKEDSGGDTMGFSLAYNGGNDLQTIESVLPDDTFGIIRHSSSASGEVVVSIYRDTGIVKIMNNLDMNNKKITNVVDPTSNQDAATKKYVDDNAGGGFNNITESGSVTQFSGQVDFLSSGSTSHFNYSDGNTYIRSPQTSNFVYIQDSGGKTQIGGLLGIGAAPTADRCRISGSLRVDSDGGAIAMVGNNHNYLSFYPQGEAAGRRAYIGFGSAGTNNLTINSSHGNTVIDSNLGIGINPSYKLDVNGNACIRNGLHVFGESVGTSGWIAKLRWTGNDEASFASSDWYTLATGGIQTTRHYNASVALRCGGKALFDQGIYYAQAQKESDRRIKRDIQPVEFEETLKIIREIPLRKYAYIDPKYNNGEVLHEYRTFGFIAQEVEESYPTAVDKNSKFIPNIFSFYSDNEDFLKEVEDNRHLRCEYVTEDNNILLKVPSLRKKLTDTENIVDYCRIIVKETILKEEDEKEFEIFKEDADYTYFKVEKQYYWVFIYGFMVSDFKSIDTDDVMFLHHKAIQDIDTVQQAEKTKVGTLETQNTELLSKVNNLETENTQLKDKVTDLENQIKAIKEHLGI